MLERVKLNIVRKTMVLMEQLSAKVKNITKIEKNIDTPGIKK